MATLSKQEKRRQSAQLGQKRAMAGRRCPKCGRGNATTKENNGDGWIGRRCRYCDYATGGWV